MSSTGTTTITDVTQLCCLPPELLVMILRLPNIGDLDRLSFRQASRECADLIHRYFPSIFTTCVLDFSRNTGKDLYRSSFLYGSPMQWDHVFNFTRRAGTRPRNWSLQRCRRFYARMTARRMHTRYQPTARVIHFVSYSRLYPRIKDNCTRLAILIDNMENATFPSFFSSSFITNLVQNIPRLRDLELRINIYCAEPAKLKRFVTKTDNLLTIFPRVSLTIKFYGNKFFRRALNQPDPFDTALAHVRNAKVLEVHDYVSRTWSAEVIQAMRSSLAKLERLAVGSGPSHDEDLDNVLVAANQLFSLKMPCLRELKVYENGMLPTNPTGTPVVGPLCTHVITADGSARQLP